MQSLVDITTDYFVNLFFSLSPTPREIDAVLDFTDSMVGDDMNTTLCEPFSVDEVRRAVFDISLPKIQCLMASQDFSLRNFGQCLVRILRWLFCRFLMAGNIQRNRKVKTGYAGLKLDMRKAYDRVEWSFLKNMMLKLGFAEDWVNLIMRCVTTVSYSFRINHSIFWHYTS